MSTSNFLRIFGSQLETFSPIQELMVIQHFVYQLDIKNVLLLATVIVGISSAAFLWRNRQSPGLIYLIIILLLAAFFAFTYEMELISLHLETKIFWSKISYLSIAFLPVFYFLFSKSFSQTSTKIQIKTKLLISVIPVVTLILVFTNQFHNLIWSHITLDYSKNLVEYGHGIWFWLFWIYSMSLIVLGFSYLMFSLYTFSSFYKAQILILLAGSVFPIVGNLLYISEINPIPNFDWTPVAFIFTGLIYAFGILRFQMFDLVPVARNTLADVISDGIIVINKNNVIEDHNPAINNFMPSFYGLIVGKKIDTVFPQLIEHLKNTPTPKFKILELALEIDEQIKNVEITISHLYATNKTTTGQLILFHDITAKKKALTAIEEANIQLKKEISVREKLINDLEAYAHTVAHDIKNTLGGIIASNDMMREYINLKDFNLIEDINDLIQKSAHKTLFITQELLTLATVRNKEIKPNVFNMEIPVKEAINRLQYQIREKNAIIKLPASWPVAIGHAPWIEEVWYNYLSNAIKYGGIPPIIELGATQNDNNMVKFWIRDNGHGLTPAQQQIVFKEFVRFDVRQEPGHGLGLAIAYRIIDKLGGKAGVESSGIEGEGCTFYFILPAVKELIKTPNLN